MESEIKNKKKLSEEVQFLKWSEGAAQECTQRQAGLTSQEHAHLRALILHLESVFALKKKRERKKKDSSLTQNSWIHFKV